MLIPAQIRRPHPLAYALTAVVVVVIGIFTSAFVYYKIDSVGRSHVVDRVETVAAALSARDVRALTGTEGDLGTESYQRIKSLLTSIREVNRDVRFVYLIGRHNDGSYYFIVDSEDSMSNDYSPPGQPYEDASPVMEEFFRSGQPVTEGPVRDHWGVWVSGFAPLRDASGNLIALVGLDVPAFEFLLNAGIYALLPLLLALLVCILLGAAERAHARDFRTVEQKAEFLSIASHEIRTPLTGIRWAIETILGGKNAPTDPALRTLLERVHESCLTLISRVNNLLDVTAFENRGQFALRKAAIEIYPFIQGIAESLALSAEQRKVHIVLDPSVNVTGTFMGDPQTMHHVFFNLISNGVKYTNEGTEVRISYERAPKVHRFRVLDQGPGMSAEDLTHIFEGYHRTEDAIRSGQFGSGLGLYLVRTATELHGGRVDVSSVPGKGAVFTLEMPA